MIFGLYFFFFNFSGFPPPFGCLTRFGKVVQAMDEQVFLTHIHGSNGKDKKRRYRLTYKMLCDTTKIPTQQCVVVSIWTLDES